jgi:hypothetical protein
LHIVAEPVVCNEFIDDSLELRIMFESASVSYDDKTVFSPSKSHVSAALVFEKTDAPVVVAANG